MNDYNHMQKKQLYIIVISIVVFTAGSTVFAQGAGFIPLKFSLSAFDTVQQKQHTLEGKVTSLETQLKTLQRQYNDLSKQVTKLKAGNVAREEQLTGAVSKVAPSVVSIVISKDIAMLEVTYENPFGNDPAFQDTPIRVPVYRQKGTTRQKIGAGTGFIVTPDGFIVTNRHVVTDDTATYTVLLSNGTQKTAKVVYKDPDQDVAIIKIDGNAYTPVTFVNSDTLRLGQTAIAIGNALGEYNNSVTVGILSGIDRSITAQDGQVTEQLDHILQTDAAINPGNSGGPLLDLDGRAVGINVATAVGSNNISFAIPSNVVKMVLEKFLGRTLK